VPFYLGQRTPPYSTATSIQKCIRTPDIDEVGITTRHNTFFQMAGNFSFGDYFKRGAIELAWTLLTNDIVEGGYGMDPERIWTTVYFDDDEAVRLWQEIAGLPAERPLLPPAAVRPPAWQQPVEWQAPDCAAAAGRSPAPEPGWTRWTSCGGRPQAEPSVRWLRPDRREPTQSARPQATASQRRRPRLRRARCRWPTRS